MEFWNVGTFLVGTKTQRRIISGASEQYQNDAPAPAAFWRRAFALCCTRNEDPMVSWCMCLPSAQYLHFPSAPAPPCDFFFRNEDRREAQDSVLNPEIGKGGAVAWPSIHRPPTGGSASWFGVKVTRLSRVNYVRSRETFQPPSMEPTVGGPCSLAV
jgi:hypothetical protein